jgi:hypothetical protein
MASLEGKISILNPKLMARTDVMEAMEDMEGMVDKKDIRDTEKKEVMEITRGKEETMDTEETRALADTVNLVAMTRGRTTQTNTREKLARVKRMEALRIRIKEILARTILVPS